MSWLRFASDWRNGPLQRHPWLPWFALLVLALAGFIVWGHGDDRGRGGRFVVQKGGSGPPPTGFMPAERRPRP